MNRSVTVPFKFDLEVDAKGLNCPLPLLRLKKALNSVQSGQVVFVQATDAAAVIDFGVFLEQVGHELVNRWEDDRILYFLIRKR